MKISVKELKQIYPTAQFINLQDNELFDYLDIAKVKNIDLSNKKNLHFCVYENSPNIEGWYDISFDRRANLAKKIKKNPNWTFVVELDTFQKINSSNTKFIVVPNTLHFSKKIFEFVLKKVTPKVIGVTGSVGKTTTVSMIEDVVSIKYSCLRVYTKRITPLTLYSYIVNYLEYHHDVVVLELALWKHHVKLLAELIKPDIAIILNIRNMHVGVKTINTVKDIIEGKLKIVTPKSKIVLNVADEYLSKVSIQPLVSYSAYKNVDADIQLKAIQNDDFLIKVFDKKVILKPYIPTRLYIEQVLASLSVAHILSINLEDALIQINNFFPKENRIPRINIKGKKVYLDADVTHSARLLEMADNFSLNKYLVLHHIDFNLENPKYLKDDFSLCFSKFDIVIINDNQSNREALSQIPLTPNVLWKAEDRLLDNVNENSFIVYHYSMYFKKYSSVEILSNR